MSHDIEHRAFWENPGPIHTWELINVSFGRKAMSRIHTMKPNDANVRIPFCVICSNTGHYNFQCPLKPVHKPKSMNKFVDAICQAILTAIFFTIMVFLFGCEPERTEIWPIVTPKPVQLDTAISDEDARFLYGLMEAGYTGHQAEDSLTKIYNSK